MNLIFPLNSVFVTAPFGDNRNHNGTDFRASVGTPIYAPASGTVDRIFTTDRGGKQLILKHANGYTTGYAHLSEYIVNVGDKVKSGETIAYSGNTGVGTGPHLHFTVKKNGVYKDPMTVLMHEYEIEDNIKTRYNWQNAVAILVLVAIVVIATQKLTK